MKLRALTPSIALFLLFFALHTTEAQVIGDVPKGATFAEGLAFIQKAQADPRQTTEFYYAYLGKALGWRKIGEGNKDTADSSGLPAIYAERERSNLTDPVYLIHIHPTRQGELQFSQPSGGDLLIAANSKLDPNNRKSFEEINLVVESRGVWSYGVRTDAAAERIIRDDKTLLSNPLFADPAIQADIAKYKAAGVFPNGFTVSGNDRLAGQVINDILTGKYGKEVQERLVVAFKNGENENFFIVQNIALKRYARGTISYDELKTLYASFGLSLSRGDAEATVAAVEQTNFNDSFGIKPTVQEDGTLEKGKGFVPCSGTNCSACDFVVLGNTAIKWLITIAFLFFAVLSVRAGIKLVVSQGNAGALTDAKSSFTNAFIGLVIVFLAFLVVDTIMRQLLKGKGELKGYGPWSEVACTEQVDPKEAQAGYFEGDAEYVLPAGAIPGVNGFTGPGKALTVNGQPVAVYPCGAGTSDRRSIPFLGGTATIHKSLVPSLQRIDSRWRQLGGNNFYRVTSVGGFDCRNIASTRTLSNHAYGLALDINSQQNPQQSTLRTDMPPAFRKLFLDEGWGWGGNWQSSKDAMHFSKIQNEGGNAIGETSQ